MKKFNKKLLMISGISLSSVILGTTVATSIVSCSNDHPSKDHQTKQISSSDLDHTNTNQSLVNNVKKDSDEKINDQSFLDGDYELFDVKISLGKDFRQPTNDSNTHYISLVAKFKLNEESLIKKLNQYLNNHSVNVKITIKDKSNKEIKLLNEDKIVNLIDLMHYGTTRYGITDAEFGLTFKLNKAVKEYNINKFIIDLDFKNIKLIKNQFEFSFNNDEIKDYYYLWLNEKQMREIYKFNSKTELETINKNDEEYKELEKKYDTLEKENEDLKLKKKDLEKTIKDLQKKLDDKNYIDI